MFITWLSYSGGARAGGGGPQGLKPVKWVKIGQIPFCVWRPTLCVVCFNLMKFPAMFVPTKTEKSLFYAKQQLFPNPSQVVFVPKPNQST